MGCHIVIFGLHNRDDNMILREEIAEKRKAFWKEADTSQMGEELELIIDRIDGMDNRISEIEGELDSINSYISRIPVIELIHPPDPEPSELFPGYNELMNEALPLLKATIAEKKQETEERLSKLQT